VRSDWVGIIDAWAARFLDEMNYRLEAGNAARFAADLAALPGVVVPQVVEEGSSADVLVTGWVEGERLSDSSAGDVRALCDTLLSAYLIQLLDTGLLHADPHPGNLLRTADGRIAILDHGLVQVGGGGGGARAPRAGGLWGGVQGRHPGEGLFAPSTFTRALVNPPFRLVRAQEVPPDYSLTLLEYIAHLSVGDWSALADDLVALGFVDSVQDKDRLVRAAGTQGGGAGGSAATPHVPAGPADSLLHASRLPPHHNVARRWPSAAGGPPGHRADGAVGGWGRQEGQHCGGV
jgi:aarF domain-containing kinase